ncbi:MAG: hypothetical protein ACTHK2_04515 [Dokdonella sp.]|uniref:hypothetical protein n=1 Tax=Dokdonella sp. TaxID=2291710 RepID=UPI003F7E0D18
MASPNVARITDSPFFKAVGPVFNAILAATIIGVGTRVLDRMDRMEAFMAAAQADKATMELRMKRAEALLEAEDSAIKTLSDAVIRLQDRLDNFDRPPRKDRE